MSELLSTNNINQILSNTFEYSILLFLLFLIIFRKSFSKFILFLTNKLAFKKNTNLTLIINSFEKPLRILPLLIFFYLLTIFFDLNQNLIILINNFLKTLIILLLFWSFFELVTPISNYLSKYKNKFSEGIFIWSINIFKYLIILLGIVSILETWGIRVGPMIAGLGLLGVAVALGAQDLFKNLISGMLILFEKNFDIGDTIFIENHVEGTIEKIGFRSTKVRKFDSTPIYLPNYIFAENPIINYSNRYFRRVNISIGLRYDTPIKNIYEIIKQTKTYIDNSDEFVNNEAYSHHVYLEKFNNSSIDILIYCYANTNDWGEYLSIKEKLLSKFKEIVSENKSDFAFPSISLYKEI